MSVFHPRHGPVADLLEGFDESPDAAAPRPRKHSRLELADRHQRRNARVRLVAGDEEVADRDQVVDVEDRRQLAPRVDRRCDGDAVDRHDRCEVTRVVADHAARPRKPRTRVSAHMQRRRVVVRKR